MGNLAPVRRNLQEQFDDAEIPLSLKESRKKGIKAVSEWEEIRFHSTWKLRLFFKAGREQCVRELAGQVTFSLGYHTEGTLMFAAKKTNEIQMCYKDDHKMFYLDLDKWVKVGKPMDGGRNVYVMLAKTIIESPPRRHRKKKRSRNHKRSRRQDVFSETSSQYS